MRRSVLTATAVAAALPLLGAVPAVATASTGADPAPAARVLAGGLVSPLSLAIADNGTRYFSQNFTGTLMRQRPGHAAKPIFQAKGGAEVGGVSVRDGAVTFTVTQQDGDTFVKRIDRSGRLHRVATPSRYERRHNPDRKVVYGFRHASKSCLAKVPKGLPARYHGIVESHPYATVTTARGTYVADAAANAIFRLGRHGRVHTVAVLPAAAIRVSAAAASANHMPACVVGKRYWFEPVPTDVEVAPNGDLVVSSLPGGPEDGSLGARGKVWRIDPASGRASLVAKHLNSPVGVAVTPNGDVFVSQLFGNVISRVRAGTHKVTTYRHVMMPGDVESRGHSLFATTKVLTGSSGQPGDVPAGSVVRLRR